MTLAKIMEIADKYGLDPKETEVYAMGADIKYVGINDNIICLDETDEDLNGYQYVDKAR